MVTTQLFGARSSSLEITSNDENTFFYNWTLTGESNISCRRAYQDMLTLWDTNSPRTEATQHCARQGGTIERYGEIPDGKCKGVVNLTYEQPFNYFCLISEQSVVDANANCAQFGQALVHWIWEESTTLGTKRQFCSSEGARPELLKQCEVVVATSSAPELCRNYCTAWANAGCVEYLSGKEPTKPGACPLCSLAPGKLNISPSVIERAKEKQVTDAIEKEREKARLKQCQKFMVDNETILLAASGGTASINSWYFSAYQVCISLGWDFTNPIELYQQLSFFLSKANVDLMKQCDLEFELSKLQYLHRVAGNYRNPEPSDASQQEVCHAVFGKPDVYDFYYSQNECSGKYLGSPCQVGDGKGFCGYTSSAVSNETDAYHYDMKFTCIVSSTAPACNAWTSGLGDPDTACAAKKEGESCSNAGTLGACVKLQNPTSNVLYTHSCKCVSNDDVTVHNGPRMTRQPIHAKQYRSTPAIGGAE